MKEKEYSHQKIETHWAKKWVEDKIYSAQDDSSKPKKYILDMFPYPSGEGLHVGHVEGYFASDIQARYCRMNGFEVLHPMGWDAFGLPTENFAIKTDQDPHQVTKDNVVVFKSQCQRVGLSFDWEREINTADKGYYKWSQWLFLQLYKKGLAYKSKSPVNWCTGCLTVLANEQVINGHCERCDSLVELKNIEQWFLKITDYIERLMKDLGKLDWPQRTKKGQINWIGESNGFEINFSVKDKEIILPVFTTRPETIPGVTFLAIAPEHPLLEILITPEQEIAVKNYLETVKSRTLTERKIGEKNKDGVLTGSWAINPLTKEKIPIFVADYVLNSYGTGVVMAVPAHDQRDFEFAKKFGLPIKEVIIPVFGEPREGEEFRKTVTAVVQRKSDGKFLAVKWKKFNWLSLPIGGISEGETAEEAAVREVMEETGYEVRPVRKLGGEVVMHFFAKNKNVWRHRLDQPILLELINDKTVKRSKEEEEELDPVWIDGEELIRNISHEYNAIGVKRYLGMEKIYEGDGQLVNSEQFTGMESKKAGIEISKFVGGKITTQFHLRDWLVSRERYWGAPIPIIYCEKCGEVPVPEKDLPVLLPDDIKDFRPKGIPPLAQSEKFINVICPKCGGSGKRETKTLDTFVDSAWYFFRFTDPKNEKAFADKEKLRRWMPVDFYVGGAEHTVGHLLYSRFITKALFDMKFVSFDEPFLKLRHQGMILGEDNRKMSKRWNNVIRPDEVASRFGADTLRMYEMFMGPLEQSKPWNTRSLVGVRRLVERIWRLKDEVKKDDSFPKEQMDLDIKDIENLVWNVTRYLEKEKYNLCVSEFMKYMNNVEGRGMITENSWEKFVLVLAPFAPFLAEELWKILKKDYSIHRQKWPKADSQKIKSAVQTIAVQLNGKLKGTIEIASNKKMGEKEVLDLVMADAKLGEKLKGLQFRKIVYVPGKVLNLVTEQ